MTRHDQFTHQDLRRHIAARIANNMGVNQLTPSGKGSKLKPGTGQTWGGWFYARFGERWEDYRQRAIEGGFKAKAEELTKRIARNGPEDHNL